MHSVRTFHSFFTTAHGLVALAVLAAAAAAEPPVPAPAPAKADAAGTRLLLPLYEVDTTDPAGTTTIFSVRNELDVPAEIEIRYFRTNSPQAPQRSDPATLQAKEVLPINIRFVDDLQVDESGVARGYVVVEALTEGALIQGDYFRVTPGEDFATGFRLLNITPVSTHDDRCTLFTMRFLNGGGFDSGTTFIVWLDLDVPPSPSVPVFALAAYDEPGNLLLARNFFADEVAFEVTAVDLLKPFAEDFGAIELQFSDGNRGHVSAVLSAENRYSVGLEAACGDP